MKDTEGKVGLAWVSLTDRLSTCAYRGRKKRGQTMKNTKFIVKVDRGGTHAPEYVQRIDRTPVKMTFNRSLALLMDKLAAGDTAKSVRNSQRISEVVSVEVVA